MTAEVTFPGSNRSLSATFPVPQLKSKFLKQVIYYDLEEQK